MNDNALILTSIKPTFKSNDLNKATDKLYELANKQISANVAYEKTTTITRKAVASILADIEARKLYKDDGLKSLAEYGETIGLEKSLTHKLENAGRMLNSTDETVKDFSAKADWSKLAILSSADESDVAKAIKDGTITTNSTSKDVSNWKKQTEDAKPKTGKVLPQFHVGLSLYTEQGMRYVEYDKTAVEDIPEIEGFVFSTMKDKDGGTLYYGMHPSLNIMACYWKKRVTADKPKAANKRDLSTMSDDELEAELARRRAEKSAK